MVVLTDGDLPTSDDLRHNLEIPIVKPHPPAETRLGQAHSSTRATQPLGSTRITRLHSYCGPVRQRASQPVLSPSRFPPLGVLPLAATPGDSFETTPSHVPYESLVRAHAACTPDTTWAVNRYPPGSSRDAEPVSVSMSTERGFDASTTDIYNHLPGPHLTHSPRAFSRAAHHEPPLTAAAHAGLIPPPAGRYRRANQPPSLAQHRSQPTRHLSLELPSAFVFTSSAPLTPDSPSRLHLQDLHRFHGLHHDHRGSALSCPLTTRQTSPHATDRSVAPHKGFCP